MITSPHSWPRAVRGPSCREGSGMGRFNYGQKKIPESTRTNNRFQQFVIGRLQKPGGQARRKESG